MKIAKYLFIFIVAFAILGAPFLGLAADGTLNTPDTPEEVIGVVEKIIGYMFTTFWLLAVGMIIYAAYLFLSAGDNTEKITTAKQILIYSLIAGAVALSANGIKAIVISVLNP